LIEAARAANWFADLVRSDINPLFFAERGKFVVVDEDVMERHAQIPEYTEEEKSHHMQGLS
jgi:hypothetical protein